MNNCIQRWNGILKYIGIGTEFFHELIENNCYYVDKTPGRNVYHQTETFRKNPYYVHLL